MTEHSLSAHTITTKYADGSMSAIKIRVDEDSIWVEHGEQWIAIDKSVAKYVIEAMNDLLDVPKQED